MTTTTKLITLRNEFHNTVVRVRATMRGETAQINERQARRAKRALCCSDCTCSGAIGTRGVQDCDVEIVDAASGQVIGW